MQRVSPPASDFDIEGITIIDSALARYQSKVSGGSFSSSSTHTTQEIVDQLTPPQLRREKDNGMDYGFGGGGGNMRDSYGAMLRDHTSHIDQMEANSRDFLSSRGTNDTSDVYQNRNEVVQRNQDSSSSEGLEYSVAMSLNYEVSGSLCVMVLIQFERRLMAVSTPVL